MTQGEVTRLKVGELADLTGKTVRALRLYEERGLLSPSMRSEGGFRLYDRVLVDRVRLISSLQSVGMSLAEIADLVSIYDGSKTPQAGMQILHAEYRRRLADVQARIETLKSVEILLEQGLDFLDGCVPCEREHLGCGCNECDRLESVESELLMVTGMTVG